MGFDKRFYVFMLIVISVLILSILSDSAYAGTACSSVPSAERYCCKYPTDPNCAGHNTAPDCWCGCGTQECSSGEQCCWAGCFPAGEKEYPGVDKGGPCTSDKQCCRGANWCTNGVCSQSKGKDNGADCTKDDECASGHCVDGVCCDSSCDKECQKCNTPGKLGKCITAPTYKCGNSTLNYIAWSCNASSCCEEISCISANGSCMPYDKAYRGMNPGGNDNIAACIKSGESTVWIDCDKGQYASTCSKFCNGGGVYAGEEGVGEYNDTKTLGCCGDDTKEFYTNGSAVYAGGSPRCCSKDSDCVNTTGGCVPSGTPIDDKKCLGGKWDYAKLTWDGRKEDSCTNRSQCLVDPKGNPLLDNQPELWYVAGIGNNTNSTNYFPKCIADGQYILDHQCDNGRWTTRTSFVAGALMQDLAKTDINYVIFCDDYEKAMNYYSYPVLGGVPLENYLRENGMCGPFPCFNNFCVALDETEMRVIAVGASLNPGTNGIFNMTRVFGLLGMNSSSVSCPNVYTRDSFDTCGISGIKYNAFRRAFVYTTPAYVSRLDTGNFLQRLASWIKAPFDRLLPVFKSRVKDPAASVYDITEMPDFDTLYVSKKCGGKYIYALHDTINITERIFINYTGFETDFCKEIRPRLEVGKSNCTYAGTDKETKYLFAKKVGNESESLVNDWLDMTAKLRVQCAETGEE